VLNKEDLEATRDYIMEKYGRLDILINAGAICPVLPLVLIKRFTMQHLQKVLDLNIIGTILPSQVFSEILRDKNRNHHQYFISFSSKAFV
jgi:NAD(P)-dependent dehydrogenase (short-subunit alcohol dehydrogenase family)